MSFHRVEYVPQILGVRTVMSLHVLQPERLGDRLEKKLADHLSGR
jgi:hypothetical protein